MALLDYQTIFKKLNQKKIDYLVVGGLAVNLHGIPRMTYDLDLMILLEPKNILEIVAFLSKLGYRPRAPVDPKELADGEKRNSWIKEKNMKAFTFYSDKHPLGEIDLLIDTPVPYPQLKKRAISIEIQGVPIPVVSIPDLIRLKRKTGRKQDISDVQLLKKVFQK
jgi:predicted nucleotidyltransferase